MATEGGLGRGAVQVGGDVTRVCDVEIYDDTGTDTDDNEVNESHIEDVIKEERTVEI